LKRKAFGLLFGAQYHSNEVSEEELFFITVTWIPKMKKFWTGRVGG